MRKFTAALALTVMLCFSYIISASAVSELSPDESLTRKRAYYPAINSTIALLSKNIGSLENIQIDRIVVDSSKDLTSETEVKDTIVAESQKFIPISSVCVYLQFSATDRNNTQEYLFEYYLASGSTHTLCLLSSSNLSTVNYNYSISYLEDSSKSIASGIAYAAGHYDFDIDLTDYQNNGYSLSVSDQQISSDDSTALFPLIRKRAYYSSINDAISLLSKNTGSLRDIKIKRIVVTSKQDLTSESAVRDTISTESQKLVTLYSIQVYLLFSASDGSSTQDYLFSRYPAAYLSYTLFPITSSHLDIGNFNDATSYLESYGQCIAPGIAYRRLDNTYYLDINLSDYQNSGYSLAV